MTDAPFSRRARHWVIGVVGASLLLALAWGVLGPDLLPEQSHETDSYSFSAVGHHALVELLRAVGTPVTVSRFDSGGRAGSQALLVVAEPASLEHERKSLELRSMLRRADRSLLVLPKWVPDPPKPGDRPGWVRRVRLRDAEQVEEVLGALGVAQPTIVRSPGPVTWSFGELGTAPNLPEPQLLAHGVLSPLVQCDKGVLLGRLRVPWGDVTVLADPDVLSNHGLAREGNGAFAVRLIDQARGVAGAVVLDETTHGFARNPSLYRALFELPLLPAALQALATLAVLLWAAMGRFGAPRPQAAPFEAGKGFLIDNTALLLRSGGHASHALRRYLGNAVAEVREKLHGPAGEPLALHAWLDENAEARGMERRLAPLVETVGGVERRSARDGARVLSVAAGIHAWKEEMVHGRRERT